jgi:hypothetical protein
VIFLLNKALGERAGGRGPLFFAERGVPPPLNFDPVRPMGQQLTFYSRLAAHTPQDVLHKVCSDGTVVKVRHGFDDACGIANGIYIFLT